MRILLVTHRYGSDIHGGGERFLRELSTRLAARGHEVKVLTTRSLCMIPSPHGYFLWDNLLPPGSEWDDGVEVRRFPVRNPWPGRGARRSTRLLERLEEEKRGEGFIRLLGESLAGTGDHCLLSGWHRLEEWDDGPARWTRDKARLIAGGKEIDGLGLEIHSPRGGKLGVVINARESWKLKLAPGRREEFRLGFSRRDLLDVVIECEHTVRPREDGRELGVALRRVYLMEGGKRRELRLSRDWEDFLRTAPEELLGKILWAVAESRPRRLARWRDYLIGPCSPRLEREALRAARDCDLVIGAMVPVTTLVTAWKAARRAGKPFLAIPLFHPRDQNHYWADFYRAMQDAAGVEANSPTIREIMEAWGLPAFSIGPGLNPDEFSSPRLDGRRFRSEYGLEGKKLLLWVGRKNASKGYRTAIEVVHLLRKRGVDALLLMVGPDDDGELLPSEGVVYTGPLPREKLLGAYAACDLFIFPSLNESYCLVLSEVRMLGKPVLGNVYCAAARGQIEHGVDGYLCTDAEDYARRAWELLEDGTKASWMGERGREKVRREREWGTLVDSYERLLRSLAASDSR